VNFQRVFFPAMLKKHMIEQLKLLSGFIRTEVDGGKPYNNFISKGNE
jgi:hypothetical protein